MSAECGPDALPERLHVIHAALRKESADYEILLSLSLETIFLLCHISSKSGRPPSRVCAPIRASQCADNVFLTKFCPNETVAGKIPRTVFRVGQQDTQES
jgi:hypothetical protein